MKTKNVVAAVIKKDEFYLIGQRNRNKHLGLQWEFPGGKVEGNESFQDALIREIYEELNISIIVHKKIAEENFKDYKINVIIHYFLCSMKEGIINITEHETILWEKKKYFNRYDFVPGDKKIFSIL